MMKHTFQKGERVVCDDGEKGTYYQPNKETGGHLLLRDNRDCSSWAPYYSHTTKGLRHDRDLAVGDWVRYEGVDGNSVTAKEGQIGQITKIWSSGNETWAKAKGIHSNLARYQEPVNGINNLVKIAPPAEEKVDKADTVIIEHDQWGRVEGVEKAWSPRDLSHWAKEENDRKTIFNESKGWREVNPTRWVPVCVAFDGSMRNLKIGSRNNPYEVYFILPEGYRWKKAEIEREEEVEG